MGPVRTQRCPVRLHALRTAGKRIQRPSCSFLAPFGVEYARRAAAAGKQHGAERHTAQRRAHIVIDAARQRYDHLRLVALYPVWKTVARRAASLLPIIKLVDWVKTKSSRYQPNA
jgi:hypothetical protein